MKRSLIAPVLLLLLASAAHAQSQDLDFEGAQKKPKTYEPFTVSELDDRTIDLNKVVTLEASSSIKSQLAAEAQAATARLKQAGFDTVEATTEKALAPIQTTANQYLREFNDAEARLNKLGYSLREGRAIVAKEVQKLDRISLTNQVNEAIEVYTQKGLEELEKQKAEMQVKLDELKKQIDEGTKPSNVPKEAVYLTATEDQCGKSNGSATTISENDPKCFVNDMDTSYSTPLLSLEPDTCQVDTPLGKALLINESWVDGGGDKNFGWSAIAAFKLNTDAKGLTIDSNALVKASVIGKSKDILEAKANFISSRTGPATSHRELSIAGKKISSKDEIFGINLISSKNEKGEEEHIQYKDEPIASHTFVVGFVPILVAVDARLAFGPRYTLDLVPVKLSGKMEWVEQVTMIASAGVGADLKLFIILAGMKGYIDLINATVGVYPSAELYLDEKNHPQVSARLSALAELVTLSGQLDLGVWAKTTYSVPQPKKGFPFVEFKPLNYEWSQTIGRYPGYRFPVATLFDKKVGYDICSGRKETEVMIPNLPRSADVRESFETVENKRVTNLEEKLKSLVSETLDSSESEKSIEKVGQWSASMNALTSEISNAGKQILRDATL